jgi:hypothetical protein
VDPKSCSFPWFSHGGTLRDESAPEVVPKTYRTNVDGDRFLQHHFSLDASSECGLPINQGNSAPYYSTARLRPLPAYSLVVAKERDFLSMSEALLPELQKFPFAGRD